MISRIIKDDLGLCYPLKPKSEVDNTIRGLDNFDIIGKRNSIIVLFSNFDISSSFSAANRFKAIFRILFTLLIFARFLQAIDHAEA